METNSPEYRKSLAPRKLIKGQDPAYLSVEDLAYAMSLPQCKNIALTGVYGSGKSSVIDTYLSTENAPKKVLHISLSNFNEESISNEQREEYDNMIEYKIFQHILYKSDVQKTKNSRFKRLSIEEATNINTLIICIIAYLISFIIVFEPKFLQVESFYEAYRFIFGAKASIVNILSDFLAGIAMIIMTYYAFKCIVNNIHKIERIKAKDLEICFTERKDVFNRLLDEILYFFKAGDYEAVIFEDLDRIKEPQKLFLKLREINILLNESHFYQKKKAVVKFIYAIKDDVFQGEVRTKFFDYIIPVVPVVNRFNAGEFMLTHYKDVLSNINVPDVKRLGLFVTSMRDLTNIMNEYILYKNTILKESMSATKLLAMTIYKNLYPQDYSMIHDGEGLLFSVFKNKHIYTMPLTQEKSNEISILSASINKEREELTQTRLIVLKHLQSRDNISKLIIKGIPYSLEDIASKDSLYNLFENDKVESYIIEDSISPEIGAYHERFEDLLKAVDPDEMYKSAIDRHEQVITAESKQKRILENQIASIKSKTLCELMKLNGEGGNSLSILNKYAEGIFKNQEVNVNELVTTLHGLIRGGYISDDYATYISYTYTGSFDENEFKFQQSVLQGISLGYDYELTHIDAFIDNIFTDTYEDKSILNFDLLNYLITKRKTVQLDSFIKTARKNPDFIVAYDNTEKKQTTFFSQLFNEWHSCIQEISAIEDNDVRSNMLHLYFRTAPTGLNLSSEDVDFISSQYKFIVEDIENCKIENLENLFKYHNVVFKELIVPTSTTKQLFERVVSNNLYVVNQNNLRVIYGPTFDTSSYSTILIGNNNIRSYVARDINYLVSLFPDTDTGEHPDSMLNLAMYTHITEECFIRLLRKQNQKLSTLQGLKADLCEAIIKEDLVYASWDVIRYAFDILEDKSSLILYIEKYAQVLSDEKLKDEDSDLQEFLLNDNVTLSDEAYSYIAKSAIYYVDIISVPDLKVGRISVLIDNDLIECNKNNIKFISNQKASAFAKFMIHHFDEILDSDENFSFHVTNELGIEILKSSLTVEQKAKFLRDYAIFNETDDRNDYARMICDFYHNNGLTRDVDQNLVVEALEMNCAREYWKVKIDLINNFHQIIGYDAERTKRIVNSLGEPYTELNTYAYQTKLDNNPENMKLLNYLKAKAPYISKIIPTDENQLKVTYKQQK